MLTNEQLDAIESEIQPNWLLTLDEREARALLSMAKRYAWLRVRYSMSRQQTLEQVDGAIDAQMANGR